MNKAVMISIQPKWCELIANGKKTVEVRKTRPKLETPFKCYIYETKGKKVECGFHFEETGRTLRERFVYGMREARIVKHYCNEGTGKVIGEFVCDRIEKFTQSFFDEQEPQDTEEIEFNLDQFCISYSDLTKYVGLKDFYAWHISDLVIYDKPKELSEFVKPCNHDNNDCFTCDRFDYMGRGCICEIKRPPQSWCYVEVDND